MRLRWQFDTMQPWVSRWVRRAMTALGVVPYEEWLEADHQAWLYTCRYDDACRQIEQMRSTHERRVQHLEFCNKAYLDRLTEIASLQAPNPMFILDMTTGKLTDAEKWKPNQGL